MTTNEQLSELGLATVEHNRASALPTGVTIYGKRGTALGTVQHFTGNKSANEIKAALKAKDPSLKGKKLAVKVNEVLSGEVDMRQQLGVAWLQAAFSSGWTCDVGILRKNRGGLNLVRVVKAEEKPAPVTQEAALAALGLSKEDLELIASLKA